MLCKYRHTFKKCRVRWILPPFWKWYPTYPVRRTIFGQPDGRKYLPCGLAVFWALKDLVQEELATSVDCLANMYTGSVHAAESAKHMPVPLLAVGTKVTSVATRGALDTGTPTSREEVPRLELPQVHSECASSQSDWAQYSMPRHGLTSNQCIQIVR